jgi:hypothetical protein
MTELFVQYNKECIDSYRSEEMYGDWREEYDFNVTGVSLTSRDRWGEEKLGCLVDVKAGEPVFVLYITYDTGDSFGRARGVGEIIWVFKDATLAMKAKVKYEEENSKSNPEFTITFEVDGGETLSQSNPAAGYFENFGYASVETFLVNP